MREADRPRFERGLAKMLYATAGTHSPSAQHLKTYWSALKDLPIADIERAMLKAIREDDRHVTPANLRHRVEPSTSYANSQHPAVVASRQERPHEEMRKPETPFERMYADATISYALRLSGPAKGAVDPATYLTRHPVYDGEFDFMVIVNNAPLPEAVHVEEHRRVWSEFRSLLRAEWAIFETQNTPPDAA